MALSIAVQVFAPLVYDSASPQSPGYAAIFDALKSLPLLQVLRVKVKWQAGTAIRAGLPGLAALRGIVMPHLIGLDIDVGLPPSEQVSINLTLRPVFCWLQQCCPQLSSRPGLCGL